MPETSWVGGVVALIAGVVSAALVSYLSRFGRQDGSSSDTPLADLEERAAHAVDLLRDLEEQRPRLDAASYTVQKERLERDAADALRARDAKANERPPSGQPSKARGGAPTPAASTPGLHPQLKGFLWGGGTAGAVALVAVLLTGQLSPRSEGGSLTGNTSIAPQPDTTTQALVDRIRANPKDVDAMVALTRILLRDQRLDDAAQLNAQVLALAPDNVDARVQGALLTSARGDAAGAAAELDALLEAHPTHAPGWLYRGMLAMQAGNSERVRQSWEKFVEVAPDGPQKERIRGFLQGKGLQMPRSQGAPASSNGSGTGAAAHPLPDDLDKLLAMSRTLLRQQRFGEAVAANAKALTLDPDNPEAQVHAAVLQSAKGDVTGAMAALDTILTQHASLAEGWFYRGMLGMMSGQPEVTQESWTKYVQVAPDSPRKERIQGFLDGKGLQMPR